MMRKILHLLRAQWDRLLLGAVILLLAATFFRPDFPGQRPLFDYIFVLDVTQSMNVEDYSRDGKPVSRLDFVKLALHRTLRELPCGSKVGWGIFTEYRSYLLFMPVEVCANYPELIGTLDHMDGRMAWTGNSEIAKGFYSALNIAKSLEPKPAVVFMTDGQEAPPINPRHRPDSDLKRGEVAGLIVGAGGYTPMPIPKVDASGQPLGFWRADEVAQVDLFSLGRGGSVAGEKLVETEPEASLDPAITGVSGNEHLSFVREAYLKLLGAEKGLGYHHLQSAEGLAAALTNDEFARETASRIDLRYPLAALALVALLAVYLAGPLGAAIGRVSRWARKARRKFA